LLTEAVRGSLPLITTKPDHAPIRPLTGTTEGTYPPFIDPIKKRNNAILEAIRNWTPPPEYWEKVRKEYEDYLAYMELPKHEGNCHCARCMSEFLS
jgi:hypothetical protein